MEQKFKFSDNPTVAKTIYGAVIALLCITAIIIGIVAANNRTQGELPDDPPAEENGGNTNNGENGDNTGGENQNGTTQESTTFIAPISGTVMTEYSLTVPVYSVTLEEWRVHTGIDISCEEAAEVFAAAPGEVTAVKTDAMLGNKVEITHANGMVSVYANLAPEGLPKVGDKVLAGQQIGTVGDSSLAELAEEPHLHFAIYAGGVAVDPLEHISEESKRVSLGIEEDDAA